MPDFFRAYEAQGTQVPTFFIESTAPDNVDDEVPSNRSKVPEGLVEIAGDQAIGQIAQTLAAGEKPNLVVMVHGFNNPREAVLRVYRDAALAIDRDSKITGHAPGLVCVGYRWPSEKMGAPAFASVRALPSLPIWICLLGAAFVLFPLAWFYLSPNPQWLFIPLHYGWNLSWAHFIALCGWTIAGLVLTAILLRIAVYFRDQYRAANYGVPDLVQVIRVIENKVLELRGQSPAQAQNDVELSFIGHSMGGFVVTNAIRVLTDAFDVSATSLGAFGRKARDEGSHPTSAVGHVFHLMRFVLASPDIPAEHLLSSRSNFLASALSRFDEAYLFSNEGDEVLRQISTLANYFSFPTKSRNHGWRLGNVEILSRGYGVIGASDAKELRIGNLTIAELDRAMHDAAAARTRNAGETVSPYDPARLPAVFSYFDCTDYVDADTTGAVRPLLTFALRRKRNNASARLGWRSHLRLLGCYLVRQRPNVHGGYFEGALTQQLIFRLACLGFRDTRAAFGGVPQLSAVCSARQIRVLLSPTLP